MKKKPLISIYWFSILLSTIALVLSAIFLGLHSLLPITILVALEITFSIDNAIINSKILKDMSQKWKKIFLSVGIIIAVFVVRCIFPILLVKFCSGDYSIEQILDFAFNDPHRYHEILKISEPIIGAFGGSFLLLVALEFYFSTYDNMITRFFRISQLKAMEFLPFTLIFSLFMAFTLYLSADDEHKFKVFIASILASFIHLLLQLVNIKMENKFQDTANIKTGVKTGMLAFSSFLYLEVLDASFSLDGVIGAFAISNNIAIIMIGLGIGALFVRSMTIHLVQNDTLSKYKYLDLGAHIAIFVLGLTMIIRMVGIEFFSFIKVLPEWTTGIIGLVIIFISILFSKAYR